jgi:Lysozyme like domain
MADLSNHQILDLAYEAGWRKSGDLERALAVVLAESSGNPNAVSYTGCCHGLYQINTNSTSKTPAELKDPKTNTAEAFRLWSSRGWQPWNSSRGGQLLRGPEARASLATWHASPGLGSQGVGGAIGEAAGAVTGAVPGVSEALGAVEKARAWITTPANLGRLATALIAGVIIVVGVATLLRPAIEKTAQTVSNVKPL